MSIPSSNLIRAGVVVVGVALSGVVFAQDAGVYISGAVGVSKMDIDASDGFGFTGTTADETKTAWKLNIGYQFNRNWGIEFGFVDFGSFSVDSNFGGSPVTASVDATAWTLSAVGTVPLGTSNFSLYGKLGFAQAQYDGSGTISGTPLDLGSDRETDIFGAIGVRYDFNRNFGVQLEADHYNFDEKINTLTVGVRYKF